MGGQINRLKMLKRTMYGAVVPSNSSALVSSTPHDATAARKVRENQFHPGTYKANAVDYILGLPGNAVLSRLVETEADDVRVRRAEAQALTLRCYAEVHFVVTSIATGGAEWR